MTRYRLDSQFHCSYLESRGVPGKTGSKMREITPLSFPIHDFRFRWRHFRWRHIRWCNFRWCMRTWSLPVAPHCSPSNAVWAVLIYYSYGQENVVYTSPVAFSTPAPASQLPPPKKMRTAFRKRECARVSKVGGKGEGVGINDQAKTLPKLYLRFVSKWPLAL